METKILLWKMSPVKRKLICEHKMWTTWSVLYYPFVSHFQVYPLFWGSFYISGASPWALSTLHQIISEERFFHFLALWLLTTVTEYPGALWLALWDLDTLFLFVHLYLSIALSFICAYKMREKHSVVLKEILWGETRWKTLDFRLSN